MFGKKRNDDEYVISKVPKARTFGQRFFYAAIAVGSFAAAFSVDDPFFGYVLFISGMAGVSLVIFPK